MSIFLHAKLNASCALALSPATTAASKALTAVFKEDANEFKNEVVGYENIYVNNIKIKAIEIKAKHNIKKYEFKYCLKKFFLIFFSC